MGNGSKKIKALTKTRFHYSERQDRLRIKKGIGTHSKSEITYDISNATYKRFNSYVGIDQEPGGKGGSVVFKVLLDGAEVFNSGTMYYNTPTKFVDVDLTGKKRIKTSR
ncbi:NPCBM/NEW2 domain-containing protein [Bacillus cereus]